MATLRSIDLNLAHRLSDQAFRREWFRAELESQVPDMFRDLREHRNLTQSDLAAIANMKQSSISRFEKSRDANWKLETLIKLAEALDAQLSIRIEPAEQVIARYATEETGDPSAQKSILDATSSVVMQTDYSRSSILSQPLPVLAASVSARNSMESVFGPTGSVLTRGSSLCS